MLLSRLAHGVPEFFRPRLTISVALSPSGAPKLRVTSTRRRSRRLSRRWSISSSINAAGKDALSAIGAVNVATGQFLGPNFDNQTHTIKYADHVDGERCAASQLSGC